MSEEFDWEFVTEEDYVESITAVLLIGPEASPIEVNPTSLADASSYFEAVFFGQDPRTATDESDVSPEAFEAVLDFIGKSSLDPPKSIELAWEIRAAAKKFRVTKLDECVTEWLKHQINRKNAFGFFRDADATGLLDEGFEDVIKHLVNIDDFFSKDFLKLSKQLVHYFVRAKLSGPCSKLDKRLVVGAMSEWTDSYEKKTGVRLNLSLFFNRTCLEASWKSYLNMYLKQNRNLRATLTKTEKKQFTAKIQSNPKRNPKTGPFVSRKAKAPGNYLQYDENELFDAFDDCD